MIKNLFEEVDGEIIYETWKPIVDYEGLYEISSFGRIKSLFRKKVTRDKIFKPQTTQYGYYNVSLHNADGISKTYLVHILVAKYFVPNPENKPEVNHKKGIKKDNRFWQLEWATKLENVSHAFETGLVCHKGTKNSNHKLEENDVLDIFNSKLSYSNLAIKYCINSNTVCGIKKGKRWSHLTGQIYIRSRLTKIEIFKIIESIKYGISIKECAKIHNKREYVIRQIKNRPSLKKYF